MLRLYNTLSKKIEVFKPLNKKEVRMYNCGPTVYDYAHIGNLRSYVFVDLLKRYLRYSGYKVKHITNITDVDDKTIKGSRQSRQSLKEYTDFYLKEFIKDIKTLNVEFPEKMPRAAKHINEMTDLIKILLKKGYAYESDHSIYFKISKAKDYGKLAGVKKQDLNRAAKISVIEDEYKKENMSDFALWKGWKPQDRNVFWKTKIGKGRPGWHIECSAMSIKYLGKSFDIHLGGIDLIFPHHTNEIAQSESATGKKFVNYWLHNAHLLVNGEKMSKSLGNFYTLKDIAKKGYNPLLLRLILLKTHYRKTLDFSFENFEEAKSIAEKILNFLLSLDALKNKKENNFEASKKISQSRIAFKKAMDDDLNASRAFSSIFEFIGEAHKKIGEMNAKQAKMAKDYIFEIDNVFGFIKPLYDAYKKRLSGALKNPKIKKLLEKRAKLRIERQYETADKIREKLLQENIVVKDAANGGFSVALKIDRILQS